jgi:hypothetical protein
MSNTRNTSTSWLGRWSGRAWRSTSDGFSSAHLKNHFLSLAGGLFSSSMAFFDFSSMSWILSFMTLLRSSFSLLRFTFESSFENSERLIDLVSACSSKLSSDNIFLSFCCELYFLKPFDLRSSGTDILERLVGLRP